MVFTIPADAAVLVERYAAEANMSPQDFISQAVQEKLEDMADLALYEQAMAEYRADPVTYSHEEVGKMLGLTP